MAPWAVIDLSLRRRRHEAVSFERQAELVLDQMKECREAAGCTDATHVGRYFPVDIEVDCVAVV